VISNTAGFSYLSGMTRFLLLWIFLLVVPGWTRGQVPATDRHWRLVFEDTFDSIDHSVWKVAHHYDHYGEPQVYTNRTGNISIDSGELVLTVRKENYRCRDLYGWACNQSRYDYTSGWIETRKEHYIRFGYLEARIRIPHGYGFWPAFWTYAGDDLPGRRNAAEIDIFEMLGTEPPTVMGTNLHIAYCNCGENDCECAFLDDPMCPQVDSSILCHGLDVEVPDYSLAHHVYGLEWSPSKIIWYVDGRMVRVSRNPGITDPVKVIFNVAITPWNLPDGSTPFPSSMRVDYLKIYNLFADGETIDSCQVNPAVYDWEVKRNITIGGGDCTGGVEAYGDLTLRATEGIEIRGDFSVPLGAQLYLDVNERYDPASEWQTE
jgi:beta-glucanase (GH16 family)